MASGGLSVKELNDLLDRLASSENRCFVVSLTLVFGLNVFDSVLCNAEGRRLLFFLR